MRSRLAEGGALAMRVSLVFFYAAPCGAAVFFAVEARIKVSLPSPNVSVDQRKSPGWHARIGSLVQRRRRSRPTKFVVRHASPISRSLKASRAIRIWQFQPLLHNPAKTQQSDK